MRLLFALIVSTAGALTDLTCNSKPYNKRTCCENKLKYVDKYKGNFLAYDCSYKHYSELITEGGWYCVQPSIDICCNMQEGWIAPLGDPAGTEHSEPSDFRCEGLSTGIEDGPLA